MTQPSSHEWINHFLETDPPRSKSLVMTIFGDAIAPHGGRLWLGSLIELVAPLGVTDRLVRTSVFRLVQEGWLVANREGRRSSYALQPDAAPRFARANRRIYAPPGVDWNGRWTLLLAPNGSIDSALRAAVRKELEWEGFAMLAPGLLAHPAADPDGVAEVLRRVEGGGKIFVCAATELPCAGARPLAELVREGWDLSAVVTGYRRFIKEFSPLLDLLRGEPEPDPQQAFIVRTLLIHAYRRVQLHDPMLPLALLPQPWPGSEAYALAQAIYRLVWAPAERHLMDVLRREDAGAPEADSGLYERFGQLR
ncbi:phenylacetic acid degradation operon negative regulatory protein PaaX [Massilia sp. NEAU-DD11]|uniref:Phenylacetic acid degradation operon negative regulatory protein PaaX n=1 Tax=Massilia cellulosiltytica TaxID=2683234 RepID=A0A7X3G0U6_9BURK|nr:phenylacetic acid degradation operon negative regulatory protein PaaX [Telluria cellulosilytica]MVW61360.1 phenylacetic acid degradation operon negative regulatory protein PaaX [Telluria cellulosilytica]